MALVFDIKDIDLILKLTSGNTTAILGKVISKKVITTEQLNFKENKINGMINVLKKIKKDLKVQYNEEFIIYLDEMVEKLLVEKNVLRKEKLIKDIGSNFARVFPLKIFIVPGKNEIYMNEEFFSEIFEKINQKNVLFLQCKKLIKNKIMLENGLEKYKELFFNLNREPGLFFFAREEGYFFPVLNKNIEEILSFFSKYFKTQDLLVEPNKSENYRKREKNIKDIIKKIKEKEKKRDELTIFHLSDLHLGNVIVSDGDIKNLLKNIKNDLGEKNIFFITGDLVDTPNIVFLEKLETFKEELRELNNGKTIYFVTGNHDKEFWGNFRISNGEAYFKKLKNIIGENSGVSYLDDENLLIIKIDSSRERTLLARGKIGETQLNYLDKEIAKYPDDAFKIALLHHHPIKIHSFDPTIKLTDSKKFIKWSKKNKIDYILHGHKHVANKEHQENMLILSADTALVNQNFLNYNTLKYDFNCKKIVQINQITYNKETPSNFANFTKTFSYLSYFLY